MKSRIVFTLALASAISMGAMYAPAHALDLGISNRTGVNAGTNNDASGGILARSNTRVGVGVDADTNARTDRDDSNADTDARIRQSNNINSDVSAGADANADLRNDMRNDIDAASNANVDADINDDTHVSLFGISLGARSNNRVSGSLND